MLMWRVLARRKELARQYGPAARCCSSHKFLDPQLCPALRGVSESCRYFSTKLGPIDASRVAGQHQLSRTVSTLQSEEKHPLVQEPPMCQCGDLKVVRVVSKPGPNLGRKFFACPKPSDNQCQDDFQWCDEPSPPVSTASRHTPRHTLAQESPMCQCGVPKIVRVVSKLGPNLGREFFCCPKPMDSQCQGQFQWADEPLPPICNCGKPKVKRKVSKSGPNNGREFFTCPKPYIPACTSSFEWCEETYKGLLPWCACGNRKVRKTVKNEGPNRGRAYLVCPNPQTCDGAFEWVEERESDTEREMIRKHRESEGRRIQEEEEGLEAEELNQDIRGFVLPPCDLFNEARWSRTDTSPTLTEVLRLPYPKSSLLPSVTKILQATMSEESKAVLARWEARMIRELGEEGFKQHKKDNFARGHRLHRVVEEFLETGSVPEMDEVEDPVSKLHLLSFSGVREHLAQPFALESAVEHQQLGYSGIVDCVARYKDQLVLIDWKTAEKEKNRVEDLYDNPLQLAAYMGAINRDPRYSELGNLTSAAVCVVYNSGLPAVTHVFDSNQMSAYWDRWLERLELYHAENC